MPFRLKNAPKNFVRLTDHISALHQLVRDYISVRHIHLQQELGRALATCYHKIAPNRLLIRKSHVTVSNQYFD